MCGIFAYSGNRPIDKTLVDGLKKLEYRGYDSAGIAFFNNSSVETFRVCGDTSKLEEQIKGRDGRDGCEGHLGIGHTRWATHGAPSVENAHPHKASTIHIVHNGILENEEELKKHIDVKLLKSETDSELIAHIIFGFYKEDGDFLQSVLKTAKLLKGSFAVAAICSDKPDQMIAFKKGPPLMFCKNEKEFFLSSDSQVVSEYAKQAIFLEDKELVYLNGSDYEVYNFEGVRVKKDFETLTHNSNSSDKQGYKHYMLKEIFEQASCVARLLSSHIDKSSHELKLGFSKGELKKFNSLLEGDSQLLILACGSSYYAGLFAKYFIESVSGIKVDIEIASEFIYRKSTLSKNTMALFISQSGETADILTACKQIKERGLKTISLCNVDGSSLIRQTDFTLSIEAGKEVAVASTKAFTNSLTALMLLGVHIAKLKKQISPSEEKDLMKSFLSLPTHIEEALNYDKMFLKLSEEFKKFSSFFYLGRGLYYSIALEGALKLKEIAYLHAEAYPAGEMKHGPLAMIDKNMLAIFLMPPKQDVLYEKTMINLKEAKARGANVIAIGDCGKSEQVSKLCSYQVDLPNTHPFLYPLVSLIPLQIMAYYISVSCGYNPDRPKNLAKSVTVE